MKTNVQLVNYSDADLVLLGRTLKMTARLLKVGFDRDRRAGRKLALYVAGQLENEITRRRRRPHEAPPALEFPEAYIEGDRGCYAAGMFLGLEAATRGDAKLKRFLSVHAVETIGSFGRLMGIEICRALGVNDEQLRHVFEGEKESV